MIQIKLVGMTMIFYHTKHHWSNCNSSWVISIKKNTKFNFQPPSTFFTLLVFYKNDLNECLFILCSSISTHNFRVPCWSVQVLHPPQKAKHPLFRNGWQYGIKCMALRSPAVGRDRMTDGQTDWWTHKPHIPFLKESKLKKKFSPGI
jgi:hypothetical protein